MNTSNEKIETCELNPKVSFFAGCFTISGFILGAVVIGSLPTALTSLYIREMKWLPWLMFYSGLLLRFFLWSAKNGSQTSIETGIETKEQFIVLKEQVFATKALTKIVELEVLLSLIFLVNEYVL